jgi:hypothetical protein
MSKVRERDENAAVFDEAHLQDFVPVSFAPDRDDGPGRPQRRDVTGLKASLQLPDLTPILHHTPPPQIASSEG